MFGAPTTNAVSWRYSEKSDFVGKVYEAIPKNEMGLPSFVFTHDLTGYDGKKDLYVQLSDKDGIENIITDSILLDRKVPALVTSLTWDGAFIGGSGTAIWENTGSVAVKSVQILLYEGPACESQSGDVINLDIDDDLNVFIGLNPTKIYTYKIFAMTSGNLPYASPCSGAGSAIIPANLTAFSGVTSSTDYRSITLGLTFPASNDYAKVEVYRKPGLTPPISCNGDLVATITDFSSSVSIDDQLDAATPYQRYSYRACITSQIGLENNGGTTTGHYPSLKYMINNGGYNWYAGIANETCAEVCANKGGYNVATKDYAGGDGVVANTKLANCTSILDDLWAPTNGNPVSTINNATGCFYMSNGERYDGYLSTLSSSTTFAARRICACGS